jgi:hypothetical protein
MNETVPYIVHEGDMARMDRMNKRLWIVIILLVVLLVASNCGWLWYESQFEDEVVTTTTQTVKQDANADKGDATINDGVHINGESKTNSK